MKPTYSRGLAAAVAAAALGLGVSAQTTNMILDTSGAPKIVINGTTVNFTDGQPGKVNGTLMVPVRDVCQQYGATVTWDNDEKEVQICLPSKDTVTLETNQTWLAMQAVTEQRAERFANGQETTAPTPFPLQDYEVTIINDRAYMPINQLAMAINCTGQWDGSSDTATITVGSAPSSAPGAGTPINQ